ncbi:MAG: Smr/MutS family protein [Flavobacteriales bacterium]|jgi:dsDNA-specific endonuclease/ATPase MutS2
MNFKIGDRVRFLNDEGEGKIIDFPSENIALVEDVSGFAYEHQVKELVHIMGFQVESKKYDQVKPDLSSLLERNIDSELVKKANADFKSIYKSKSQGETVVKGELMEVDLHAHEILDSQRGLTNGEIVVAQIEHFERMLRNAEEKKIPRVVFIHGVGQGVLRQEIRKILNDYYPHCEFMDAPYHTYGYGATEVRIHPQRKMR